MTRDTSFVTFLNVFFRYDDGLYSGVYLRAANSTPSLSPWPPLLTEKLTHRSEVGGES